MNEFACTVLFFLFFSFSSVIFVVGWKHVLKIDNFYSGVINYAYFMNTLNLALICKKQRKREQKSNWSYIVCIETYENELRKKHWKKLSGWKMRKKLNWIETIRWKINLIGSREGNSKKKRAKKFVINRTTVAKVFRFFLVLLLLVNILQMTVMARCFSVHILASTSVFTFKICMLHLQISSQNFCIFFWMMNWIVN